VSVNERLTAPGHLASFSSLDQAKMGTATAPGVSPIQSRLPNHRVLAVPIFCVAHVDIYLR
jgi:hypothetical protein